MTGQFLDRAFCWLSLLFLLSLAVACTPPAIAPADRSAAEAAVLTALIEAYTEEMGWTGYTLLLDEQAGLGPDALGGLLGSLPSQLPGLAPEIIDDFQQINGEPQPLAALVALSAPHRLLGHEELAALAALGKGSECWHILEERYPNARGVITISRVGLSPRRDQALAYISSAACGSGGGLFYYLAQKNGAWTIQAKVLVWIS